MFPLSEWPQYKYVQLYQFRGSKHDRVHVLSPERYSALPNTSLDNQKEAKAHLASLGPSKGYQQTVLFPYPLQRLIGGEIMLGMRKSMCNCPLFVSRY